MYDLSAIFSCCSFVVFVALLLSLSTSLIFYFNKFSNFWSFEYFCVDLRVEKIDTLCTFVCLWIDYFHWPIKILTNKARKYPIYYLWLFFCFYCVFVIIFCCVTRKNDVFLSYLVFLPKNLISVVFSKWIKFWIFYFASACFCVALFIAQKTVCVFCFISFLFFFFLWFVNLWHGCIDHFNITTFWILDRTAWHAM